MAERKAKAKGKVVRQRVRGARREQRGATTPARAIRKARRKARK